MELNIYFEPVTVEMRDNPGQTDFNRLGDIMLTHTTVAGFPSLEKIKIALLTVKRL